MTPGQELALHQLRRIEAARPGSVTITEIEADKAILRVTVSLDCRGLPHAEGVGVRLRQRERFTLHITKNFPFTKPEVWTPHRRWAGVPHVQWSRYLCLYLAPELEWDPSDGMFGFVDRLIRWLTAASLGDLDPIDGPVHPPAVYSSEGCPTIVPRADTPELSDSNWWGFARMRAYGDHRRDINGWCDIRDARAARDAGDQIAPAILLNDPMPWEYPSTFLDLLVALIDRGVSSSTLFTVMSLANLLHDGEYVYLVIGSPSRGVVGGETVQHLAVWRFKADLVESFYATTRSDGDDEATSVAKSEQFSKLLKWAAENRIMAEWCPVREARPEATRSRCEGSPTTEWADRRVAIWGCGALGGAVAEHLVRAGVADIVLRDNGDVAPGVLVRQNFEELDIGETKVSALKDRLQRINPDAVVEVDAGNLTLDRNSGWADGASVVFDLTASPAVAQRLEASRIRYPGSTTVVGMSISHDARHGLVVVSQPGATGAVTDVRRKAKLSASRDGGLHHIAEEFWPIDESRVASFVPEPGCSSPTFVGSDAQIAALASSMLLIASASESDPHPMSAAFVSLPSGSADAATRTFTYPNDVVLPDPINGHSVRIGPEAIAEMRGWASRTHRLAPADETGGHLYGERDDALSIVWITTATGPPPDSQHSPQLFMCGTAGVSEAEAEIRRRSRDACRPVGMWHTHPAGNPIPSDQDHQGMTQVVTDHETSNPKSAMVILGGTPGAHLLGAYVYERDKSNLLPRRFSIVGLSNTPPRVHRVGLALSGGGFRAVAFHLGVMRALHDRGVLDRVEVVSSVSGGSIISGMWAYTDETFEEFDERVCRLLRQGLNRRIAAKTFLTPRIVPHAIGFGIALLGEVLGGIRRIAERSIGRRRPPRPPLFRRPVTLTTAVQHVLTEVIGEREISAPARDVHIIMNACDLRSGTAFRFGSTETGSSKHGRLLANDIPVALAAAASAAYPVILPALDLTWRFCSNDGTEREQRVLLTDGGVYDNLGTTCLEPGRSAAHSTNVHPVDYIISADAGAGALDASAYPALWPSRMMRSFGSVYRKVQDAGKGAIYQHGRAGSLKGFVLPFLGQQDDVLRIRPPDLVRRDQVADYPTNFSPMKEADLDLLTRRGEQLTRLMIESHCPEIA